MPAYKPTASCIWNSFLNSNKKHIIITGARKIGKSTLLKELFPTAIPGITTWAEPENAVYLKENTSGQISKVGTYDPTLEGLENKMRLIKEGFSLLGITALKNAICSDKKWISIDEIGYLESKCTDYLNMLENTMEKKHVAAVVRKQNLPHLKNICERKDVFLIDLDAPFGNTGCVIMASGLGKRFGENKLMTSFNDKPLISHVLDTTSGIFKKRVVVTQHKNVAAFCESKGVNVLLHTLPYRSDTIRLGLETLSDVEHCMFCTADQPLLSHDTVASLTLSATNESMKILRPSFENIPGSPVIFPQWTFKELLHLPEGQGGGYVIRQHIDYVQYLPISQCYELEDIDTREDLIRLQELSKIIYTKKSWS